MKNKKNLYIILGVFLVVSACLKEGYKERIDIRGELSGAVIDWTTKDSVQGATIDLYSDTSMKKLVAQIATDENGAFRDSMNAGTYYAVARYQALRSVQQTIKVDYLKDTSIVFEIMPFSLKLSQESLYFIEAVRDTEIISLSGIGKMDWLVIAPPDLTIEPSNGTINSDTIQLKITNKSMVAGQTYILRFKSDDAPAVNLTVRYNDGFDLVFVEGGEFTMGNDGDNTSKPAHQVRVNDFYLSRYEITNQQYADFLNAYGDSIIRSGRYEGEVMIYYSNKENSGKYDLGIHYENGQWIPAHDSVSNHPVIYVTWYGANEFCLFYGGRLPTEAEWEYAARGGKQSQGYVYAGTTDNLDEYAWSGNFSGTSHEIGGKQGNELVLYDMTGNVAEWCYDRYDGNYYNTSPSDNPTGPEIGEQRVLRGGHFSAIASLCTVYSRSIKSFPFTKDPKFGFRFIRE